MQEHVVRRILGLTGADGIARTELIQPLWNDYGTLSRVYLQGGEHPSVIVKHIKIPQESGHPRGFGGSISRARKSRSYAVETRWYQHHNPRVPEGSPTPRCLCAFATGGERFLVLEDLATRGFQLALRAASWSEICVGLRWLASFHARFLGDPAEGLWPSGTYWHLATRPEELARIEGTRLHRFASLLDARLRCGGFPTVVHGDAKLANFLFTEDRARAAAVDFQYVGRGAAMKDVAYFVGSCLSGPECERREAELLAVYFDALGARLPQEVDAAALEAEWRALYPVAWADFERFMQGWSPGHYKLTGYSDATTERALDQVRDELLGAAREACLAAGRFVRAQRPLQGEGRASGQPSDAAAIARDAQALIVELLGPTIARYDLGVLVAEGAREDRQPVQRASWSIAPLGGTPPFVAGGASTSTWIALFAQAAEPLLGVAYDPVRDDLVEAV